MYDNREGREKMKKAIILLASVALVAGMSIKYHELLIKQSVVNDVNPKEESDTITIKEEEKIEETIEEVKEETLHNSGEKEIIIETIASAYSDLSNETCAWGFVRKSNGQQPEFYGPYTKVLENYQGIYCGNTEDKVLYLTFDEGYENGYTASILDTLKEKNVTAAFFVTMPYVKQNPELVKRMIAEGHIVGNHTVNHPSMPEITDNEKLAKEVTELHDYVKDNFQYEMHYLRPPKGEYSERTVKLCLDLGYRHVLWSSAYADWDTSNQKGDDNAKKMIIDNFHNGNVILLHAVSKDNASVLRNSN